MGKKEPLYPHVPKGKKMTLEAALTAQQKEAGLYLVEPDPHTVELRHKTTGRRLAVWSSMDATVAGIREAANKYLGEAPKALPELTEIAKIFYEAEMPQRATIYAWTPIYTKWENLTQSQRDEAIRGLEERIEREGLRGYLERKRPVVGDKLTETIISALERANYLTPFA